MLSKMELKKQLRELGINIHGNYIKKKDVQKIVANLSDPNSAEFLNEFKKKFGSYKEWTFAIIPLGQAWGGSHYYTNRKEDLCLYFTPDYNETGFLDIQLEGHESGKLLNELYQLPNEVKYQKPLTPEKLFNYVKPLLDKADRTKVEDKDIKCECGGDKTRTGHSTWCPKYQD